MMKGRAFFLIVVTVLLIAIVAGCKNPAGGRNPSDGGKKLPTITGVSAETTMIAVAGGTSVITVAGTNLVDGITVTAFDGETATTITSTSAGSGTRQNITLTFPANASTTEDKIYTVKASLDGGVNWAAQTAAVTVSKKLNAPANVTAERQSASSIDVSWSAVSGAASYKVYYGTSSSGEKTFLETVTTTSYSHTGLQAETGYYYWITAVNNVGESGFSSSAYAVTVLYKIGDTGPAGGIVFYYKGNDTDGWRYLEAAPKETEFQAAWGANGFNVPNTKTGVGTGKENTQIIAALLGNRGESNRAAQRCNNLNVNGFTDWFLPSKDELDWMYDNLNVNGLGGFIYSYYWSSSESSSNTAWRQHLQGGRQLSDGNKSDNTLSVRAIRAF